jgi:hypothetical protein
LINKHWTVNTSPTSRILSPQTLGARVSPPYSLSFPVSSRTVQVTEKMVIVVCGLSDTILH